MNGSFRWSIATGLLTGAAPSTRESERISPGRRYWRGHAFAPRALRFLPGSPAARRLAQLLAPLAENTRPRKLSLPGPSVNSFVVQVRDGRDSSADRTRTHDESA